MLTFGDLKVGAIFRDTAFLDKLYKKINYSGFKDGNGYNAVSVDPDLFMNFEDYECFPDNWEVEKYEG